MARYNTRRSSLDSQAWQELGQNAHEATGDDAVEERGNATLHRVRRTAARNDEGLPHAPHPGLSSRSDRNVTPSIVQGAGICERRSNGQKRFLARY